MGKFPHHWLGGNLISQRKEWKISINPLIIVSSNWLRHKLVNCSLILLRKLLNWNGAYSFYSHGWKECWVIKQLKQDIEICYEIGYSNVDKIYKRAKWIKAHKLCIRVKETLSGWQTFTGQCVFTWNNSMFWFTSIQAKAKRKLISVDWHLRQSKAPTHVYKSGTKQQE